MSNKALKNKVLSGLIWKFGERILAQGVSFIVSVILARMLTPDEYGIIAMVLVFISLADVFVNSGFATALIQKKDADETDFSTIFWCSLLCSFLIYSILFMCAPFIGDFYNNTSLVLIIRIFGLKVPLSVYNSIQHAYVSKYMMFKKFFFSTLFGTIISGIIGILCAYMKAGVWALVVQYLINTIVDTVILMVTVKWYPKFRFSKKSAKLLMNYGSKILLADLSGTFFGQFRNMVIGKVYKSSDLAHYNKGQQLPSLITNNISLSIMTVLFPALSNEGDDKEKVKQISRRFIRLLSYIMFPALTGLITIAEPLVCVLFTNKWISCVIYVKLFCIGSIIGLLSTTSIQIIKAIGRSDIVLWLEFIKKPVYIILLLIGVKINVVSIAVTMVIYELYGTVINMVYLKKIIGYCLLEQLKDILSAIILSFLMFYIVMFIKVEFIIIEIVLKIIVATFIYIFMSIIFNIEEFQYLKILLFKIIKKDK